MSKLQTGQPSAEKKRNKLERKKANPILWRGRTAAAKLGMPSIHREDGLKQVLKQRAAAKRARTARKKGRR
jgi:hypothetical protein